MLIKATVYSRKPNYGVEEVTHIFDIATPSTANIKNAIVGFMAFFPNNIEREFSFTFGGNTYDVTHSESSIKYLFNHLDRVYDGPGYNQAPESEK